MRGRQSNRRKWRIMLRRVSRWGVTALGVVLAICGVVAMVGRLGHHPGRTGVEPVYRRRDGLGRRGRRDRLGSGRLPARRNTRCGAVASRREKSPAPSAPAAKPQPKELEQRPRQPQRRRRPGANASADARSKRRPLNKRRSRPPRRLLRRRSRSKKPRRPRPTRRAAPSLERSTATSSATSLT